MKGSKVKLAFWAIELPLKRPLRTARGESKNQQTVIVEISDRDSHLAGYGEIGCVRRAGLNADRIRLELERSRNLIESYEGGDPEQFWARCDPTLRSCRPIQSGVDIAIHDLWAKRKCLPLWKAWGLESRALPASCCTVSLGTLEEMADSVMEANEWPALKLKIGRATKIADIERLRDLTSVPFRLDGNGELDATWVNSNASALVAAGGQLLEQPLPEDAVDDQRMLHETVDIPLFADESCRSVSDVQACYGAFSGVNIKVAKSGGLTPARRMIAAARCLGMQTMVGCMGETTIGISAAAQLLPIADLADLDSAYLMASDIASGVHVGTDGIFLSDGFGIGAVVDWDQVKKYRLPKEAM